MMAHLRHIKPPHSQSSEQGQNDKKKSRGTCGVNYSTISEHHSSPPNPHQFNLCCFKRLPLRNSFLNTSSLFHGFFLWSTSLSPLHACGGTHVCRYTRIHTESTGKHMCTLHSHENVHKSTCINRHCISHICMRMCMCIVQTPSPKSINHSITLEAMFSIRFLGVAFPILTEKKQTVMLGFSASLL